MLDTDHLGRSVDVSDGADIENHGDEELVGHAPRRRAGWFGSFVVLLGYSALAATVFHRALSAPASHLVGRCCDSLVAVSYLQSTGVAILHGHQPFVTTYLNAPTGVNALWQPSSSIALGIVAIPFELLFGPIATFDLFATMAVSLSGWSAYLVLRRWVGGQAGPIVGGLVFGFSSFMMVQSIAGHLDLTFLALVPPTLALVVNVVLGRAQAPWLSGLGLGAVLTLQLLVNPEILADLVITALVVTLLFAVTRRPAVRAARRGVAVATGWALGSFLLLAGWPLWVMLSGPLRPTSPIISRAVPTDLLSFASPSPLISVAPTWARTMDAAWFPDGVDQSSAYIGIVLLGVAVGGAVVLRHRPWVRVASLAAAIMAILSLGPKLRVANHVTGVPLPWGIVDHLPFLRFDVTDRFVAFADLGVAVIVAVVVQAVGRVELRWPALWITGVIAGLALLIPSTSFAATTLPTPSIFTDPSLTSVLPSGGLVYVAPFPRVQNIAPLQWQAETRMRFSMPGGYVLVPTRGGALATTSGPVDELSRSLLALEAGGAPPPPSAWPGIRAELDSDGAAAVLVGPMDHEKAVRGFVASLLRSPPRSVGGVYLWQLGARP